MTRAFNTTKLQLKDVWEKAIYNNFHNLRDNMQTNPNEPIVTFSVPMSQEDAQAWILQKAAEFNTLESLKAKQAQLEQDKVELQRKIERLDDEIFEQTERCQVTISA